MLESSSLSFPASPTINQTVDFDGKTYSWTGLGWRQIKPSFELVPVNGLELLAYGGISNAAVLDFILTPFLIRYRAFKWILSGISVVTDGSGMRMRFSTDGGATYITGATYALAGTGETDLATQSLISTALNTYLILGTDSTIGNGTTEGMHATVELVKPTSPALWCRTLWTAIWIDNVATPGQRVQMGGGLNEVAQDTDAVRFLASSNFSLDYAMYGWT